MSIIDKLSILNWWVFFFVLGLSFMPLTARFFGKFIDTGYGLAKTFALLCISFAVFFLSTLHILPFYRISLIAVFILFLLFNLYLISNDGGEFIKKVKSKFKIILLEEFLFGAGLLLWSYVRSHQSDVLGLEKLMDFGFINSILRSEFLPPTDMWFAGKSINYYWYGHFVTALIAKILATPSGIAYNLMLGTILGLSLTSSFSLVASLIYRLSKIKRAAVIGGLVTAILLNFAGNFHTPYYILENGRDKYWYPDATRFIGYNPDVPDKTIHEFPIYSYVVSDLHAHLLDLPFVLLFLSLLYAHIASGKKQSSYKHEALNSKQYLNSNALSPKQNGSSLNKLGFGILNLFRNLKLGFRISQNKILVLLGLVLGIMFMTNAWDIANYSLVAAIVLLLCTYGKFNIKKLKLNPLFKVATSMLVIIIVAVIATLPFLVNFESIAQGVRLTHTKTPLWQLMILWGFPAILTVIYGIRFILMNKKTKEDIFVLALLIASWILIFLPEFIYVKDIYAETHYRANTMFKLTYQAYVMFYLTSGYITVSTIRSAKNNALKALLVLFFPVLFASIMYYPFIAVNSYYGSMKLPGKGLSGESWLSDKNPDTYNAISWFRSNVKGQPVILEAPGDSYTEFNTISSYTGLPTVSGWFVHEWLWRGAPEFPQERVNDIIQIYTSDDIDLTRSLLAKYAVEYVIVGNFEREKYSNLIEDKFLRLGNRVFTSPTTKIYQLN